ncbi:MAG: lipopolysaccharide assembly protein LapB [Gammaproteobacteria bacterium]|nr:lipopolysaccharide assembly protein LapB [Gammaproteobacteria bacterium]
MWFFDPTLLLFLLLPVAAFSGWVIGRRQPPGYDKNAKAIFPVEYLQGLNFFLNEQPDKAIDSFIQMLDVNTETVETHLALGNLFRRRGEVDRAIRIHQNLVARPGLNSNLRAQAMFELGQDYMRAGLLDRAESVYKELLSAFPKKGLGTQQLIEVYQQEQEWDKAIEVASGAITKDDKQLATHVAHFYCELADIAIKKIQLPQANKFLNKALELDKNCVRASVLQGNAALLAGDYEHALRIFQQVESQDADFLGEVVDKIVQCFLHLHQTEKMLAYLRGVLARHGNVSIMLKLAEQLRQIEGAASAVALVESEINRYPSLRGMEMLIELQLADVNATAQQKLRTLKSVVAQLLKNKPNYQCQHCGFESRILYWHCPSCRTWGTNKPLTGVEELL